MKLIIDLIRLLVSILFVISGLIKANDPIGFGYKLEEYFEVFNLAFLNPTAVWLAVGICIFEIVLGLMLLIGARKKTTLWLLLLMIVFFTFLTFYSAYFNKVTDCGCFGDALKLTPWQSFTKDVVLLIAILILFIGKRNIRPLFVITTENTLIFISASITCLFCLYCWYYLPVKDFRPYKIGNHLPSLMVVPEEEAQPVYQTLLIYEKDGKEQEFTTSNYPWDDSTWVWKDTRNILVSKGYEPPIHDFGIVDMDGNDVLPDVMQMPFVFLVVSKKLEETTTEDWQKLNTIKTWSINNQIEMITLTGTSPSIARGFAQLKNIRMPFYFTDGTTLKTIVRSNPGLLLLKNGVVIGKWPITRMPTIEAIETLLQ